MGFAPWPFCATAGRLDAAIATAAAEPSKALFAKTLGFGNLLIDPANLERESFRATSKLMYDTPVPHLRNVTTPTLVSLEQNRAPAIGLSP